MTQRDLLPSGAFSKGKLVSAILWSNQTLGSSREPPGFTFSGPISLRDEKPGSDEANVKAGPRQGSDRQRRVRSGCYLRSVLSGQSLPNRLDRCPPDDRTTTPIEDRC
jgi:hypothetical protein